jgi:hypothetical protein
MDLNILLSSNVIVPVVVSIIGLLIAVTTAVIAKEQKVSEFRQAWINDLRNECAEYFCLAADVIPLKENVQYLKERKSSTSEKNLLSTYDEQIEVRRRMYILFNRISLKLNPEKDRLYLNKLKKLLSFNDGDVSLSIDQSIELLHNVIGDTHQILKTEWERVKIGEARFVRFRSFGELCLFALLSSVSVYLLLILVTKFPQYFPGIN